MLCEQILKIFKSEPIIGTHDGADVIHKGLVPLLLTDSFVVGGSVKLLIKPKVFPKSIEVCQKFTLGETEIRNIKESHLVLIIGNFALISPVRKVSNSNKRNDGSVFFFLKSEHDFAYKTQSLPRDNIDGSSVDEVIGLVVEDTGVEHGIILGGRGEKCEFPLEKSP